MIIHYLKLPTRLSFLAPLFLLSFILIFCPNALANEESKNIAYFEKGPFWLYDKSYSTLQEALIEKSLAGEKAKKDELSKNPVYTYNYPSELHLSPGWESSKEDTLEAGRILLKSDADIIIAAGTSAVDTLLELMENEKDLPQKPIIGIALADPVASGLITEEGISIHPNFTTEVYPGRWRSMYRVFFDLINFKKLGIMYPSSEMGRIYASVDDAYAVAEEKNFEIVEAIIPDERTETCKEGIDKLRELGAEAFFISPLVCFDWTSVDPSPLLELAHDYQMPTFARDGSLFVQGGALMGFATWDFTPSAQRLANAVEDIFMGKMPGDIRMIVTAEPQIALNLEVAEKLGLVFPFNLLLSADQIYEKTSRPRME